MPTAETSRAAGRELPRPSTQVSGRARITVRRLGVGGPLGTTISDDEGEYHATLHADGRSTGFVQIGAQRFDIHALTNERRDARPEVLERRIAGADMGNARLVVRRQRAGAPVDEIEVRRGAGVIARIAKSWERTAGGWRLAELSQTVYDGNRPAFTVTLTLDEGASESRGPADPDMTALRVPADRPAFDAEMACEKEVIALKAAFSAYELAALGMAACLLGPWKCYSAYVALMGAAAAFDAAAELVELCAAAT